MSSVFVYKKNSHKRSMSVLNFRRLFLHMNDVYGFNLIFSGGFSHTDKCKKDGIVHYILKGPIGISKLSCFSVPEACFDLSKK